MPLYTIIMDCEGGTYIRQVTADDPVGALDFWARNPDLEMLAGVKHKRRSTWAKDLIADIETRTDNLVPLTGLHSVWCRSFTQGRKFALINIVQTEAAPPERKILHVVFGLSAAGSVREALKRADLPDKVVGLVDDFSFGPTDSLDIKARQTFIEDVLRYDFEDDDVRKRRRTFWRKSLDAKRRRIVWLSRWSTMEYCNFLAWLEQNGDAPFELVDLTNARLPGWRDPSTLEPVRSVSTVGTEQYVQYRLWDGAEPFSERQRFDSMQLWGRLREENAPLRVITPEGLVSAPLDYFDADLLRHVGEDWTDARRVVGETLCAMMDGTFREGGVSQCGSLVLFSRLRALVGEGALKKKGRLYGATFMVRRAG